MLRFFTNWMFVATWVEQIFGDIFSIALAHFMSLCHILVILAVCQTFSSLFLLRWSVINDLWCCSCKLFWGATNCTHIRQRTYSINVVCVLTAPLTGYSPSLSLSLGLPIPWDTTILKLVQLITLQWPLRKEELHISHFKSKARNA